MLPKQHRLRHSVDLELIRHKGRVWRDPIAILLVRANDHDRSRFAFAASRRVGNAVARNRARRRLREVVRRHLEEVEPGWDLLFIARETTSVTTFRELEVGLINLLVRAGLLTGKGSHRVPILRSVL